MGNRVFNILKKYGFKFISVVAVCITSYFFSKVYIKEVDYFSRDFLQFFNSTVNSKTSKDIVIIDIDSNTDGFSSPIRYPEIEQLILAFKKSNPKAILLNIEPLEFSEDIVERTNLRSLLEKNNVYLSKFTKSKTGKIKFYEDSLFSDYKLSFANSFTRDSYSDYFSARRMLLDFYGEYDGDAITDSLKRIGIFLQPINSFKYAFERMNTLQLFNKYYKATDFRIINAQDIVDNKIEISLLKDKIIIIGRIDEFSFMSAENPLNLLGKPQASSSLNDSLVPLHHILANQISTLQTGDYVKYLNGYYIHIIISLVLILLILLNLDPQFKLNIFLVTLPFIIFSQIIIYSFTSFYIDMVPTYLMLISVQYIAVPLILLAMFKQKERQKLQDISNARIDALLSVSEKVAHDIRSPLGAINLILSRVNFSDPEHKEIVKNALMRIDDSAESILVKYKNKNDSSLSTFDKINIHLMLEKIISEKKILNTNIEYQLALNETENILALGYSIELERVLSNILDNSIYALKKRDNNATIKIVTKVSEKQIEIDIRDNGTGISSTVLKLLGNEEVSTKKHDKGNGIGVLHAKRTIERMNGSFEIESVDGKFTSVIIKLNITT